jgi:hypothetical protein
MRPRRPTNFRRYNKAIRVASKRSSMFLQAQQSSYTYATVQLRDIDSARDIDLEGHSLLAINTLPVIYVVSAFCLHCISNGPYCIRKNEFFRIGVLAFHVNRNNTYVCKYLLIYLFLMSVEFPLPVLGNVLVTLAAEGCPIRARPTPLKKAFGEDGGRQRHSQCCGQTEKL